MIKDTKYYNSKTKSATFLDRYGITNLEQLFDENLFANKRHVHRLTARQVRLLVSFLKNEYLGEPLILPNFLDMKIDTDFMSEDSPKSDIFLVPTYEERVNYIQNNTSSDAEYHKPSHLFNYLNCTENEFVYAMRKLFIEIKGKRIPKHITVIDFFRLFCEKEFRAIETTKMMRNYFETYVKEYDKQKALREEVEACPDGGTISDDTAQEIAKIKAELEALKQYFAAETQRLEQQLYQLEKKQTRGGKTI